MLAAGLSACDEDAESHGSLRGLPGNQLTITNSDASRAATWVYGSLPLCLESPGSVTLTGVELRAAHGVALVAAGVKMLAPGDDGIASWTGPLPPTYQAVEGHRFASSCGDRASKGELAVELRLTGAETGSVEGVDLLYREDGKELRTAYDVSITLCTKVKALPECSDDAA